MLTVKDATFTDILSFLDAADTHGKNILTVIAGASVTTPGGKDAVDASKHNVSYEARLLKRLYLKLRENM
jgi:tetratricopeptide repeat protein 30